ncbi:MAG: class I SAM-dependent methyltransferase [Deltaproteobacteria bacterium]|nr:class I SAM-dependent methyltransferase [Deltaproteobacteria bacterium]
MSDANPTEGATLTRALRRIMSAPVGRARAYSLLQRTVGQERLLQRFVTEALALRPGDRVLDVGCGPADVLAALPAGVRYTGLEPHPPYLAGAQRRFGPAADLRGARVEDLPADAVFERVLLMGVLHHLPDPEALALLRACLGRRAPGGALVALEPCPRPGRGWVEQQLYAIDRGRFVRSEEALRALVTSVAPQADFDVWEGMLRVPYTYMLVSLRR